MPFFKREFKCPIDEETRIWMENAFIWLINQFGEEKIRGVNTMLPIESSFPIFSENLEVNALMALEIVSKQMDVNASEITIDYYSIQRFELGDNFANKLISQQFDDENYSTGQYNGKTSEGKYSISLEKSQLTDPVKLVATLGHEIAHIKILGEGRLSQNDENLTDIVTVFFGLGIFNANVAFRFFSNSEKWGYSQQGYLIQQEWGYALALYAYIRNEKNPEWLKYLTKNIRSDFIKSQDYIFDNPDKVLC